MARHRSRHDTRRITENSMENSIRSNKEGNMSLSSSSKENKFEYIPVAKSDQRSALSSIANSIESMKASEKQKLAGRGRNRRRPSEDVENDAPFNKKMKAVDDVSVEVTDVMLNQLERTKQNLQERFNHLTSQLEAAEYNKVLKRNVIPRAESESDDSSSSSEEEESSSSDEEDVENEEWDEKEYLDEEALSRAKSLRCKVRETSDRICRVREELTGRIASLTEKEIGSIRSVDKDAAITEDETTTLGDEEEVTDSEDSTRMEEMAHTLREMSKTAKYVDENLPGKIEVLQETINTIERSVDKLQKQADDFDREGERHLEGLPRTERAILSRLNEGRKSGVVVEGDGEEEKEDARHDVISPEKRFALYLLQG